MKQAERLLRRIRGLSGQLVALRKELETNPSYERALTIQRIEAQREELQAKLPPLSLAHDVA